MRVRLAWGCLLCVATVASPAFAQSDERSLVDSVSVTTTDPCMLVEPVVARITHWRRSDQLDARIAVRVFDRSEHLSFEVLFQGRSVADRTFDVLPHDCVARRDAIALAVSLALDNVVQRREEIAAEIAAEPAVVSVTNSQTASPAVTTPSGAADAPHATTDGGRLQLGLVVGAAAAANVLPGVSALGEFALELSASHVMARLGVVASTGGRVALEEGQLATYLLGGRADLCIVQPLAGLALIGCGGLQTGAVRMVGSGFTQSTSSVQTWVTSAARLALEWPRGVFRARLFLEGIVPLLAPGARVVDADGATLGKITTVRAGVILGVEALVVFR